METWMANPLELNILGAPKVLYDGYPVKFATRKAMALLVYLVTEGGIHPREKLMTLFWPESTTQLAQTALRNTLVRIKKALRNVPAPLLIESNQIGFNFLTEHTLDLERVNQALAFQSKAGDLARAATFVGRTQLAEAATAVQGHFLDGFSLPDAPAFDDWINIQRISWDRRTDLVFDQLSLQQMEAHQFDLAIVTVTHWIGLNHVNEAAYRRLMRLHYLNGDPSAALQTYNLCRDLLAQELDVEPAPRTVELLEQIRSVPLAAFSASPSSAQERAPLRIPFVGRETERQQLENAYRLMLPGQTQIVAIIGESGIGKTRLAVEFLDWAASQGADILRSKAIEMSDCLPYQSVIDALRERLDCENAPEDLLDDAWLAELTPILPELRERYPDLPALSNDKKTALPRLFGAIVRLGQALANRRPLVWLIDDIKWADPDTFDLLHYLVQHWQDSHTPVLLLFVIDQDAFTQNAALHDWLPVMSRAAPSTHMTLSSLTLEDLQWLVLTMAGEKKSMTAELAEWLFAKTDGHPFILVETLAVLDREDILVWRYEGTSGLFLDTLATLSNLKSIPSPKLTNPIRDMILSRLKHLSQPAAALLTAAAVLNRSCSYAQLCYVAGIAEPEGLNALDELLALHLLQEACDEDHPYRVSHDRIRTVVYTELHQATQQVYHRRALDTLTTAQVPAAELAHHALAAREWQAAFRHSLAAGDEAMHLFAILPAIQHYKAALQLVRDAKVEAEPAACQHLYTWMGRASELQDNYADIATLNQEMLPQIMTSDKQDRNPPGSINI
jgi:DNA-binding SARP family transcriptional activator